MNAIKRKLSVVLTGLLVLALVFGSIVSQPSEVQASSANKVLKVSNLKFSNKKAANRFRGADILATQKKADKLAKSTMKISGKVYIPLTAFTKKNDEIAISPQLNLSNYPFKEGQDNYAGVVYSKYDVILKYTGSEIILYKQTGRPSNQKRTSIGSYASVKKSGDYYIVTLKNLPLTGDCFDANDEMTTIKTNKKFILNSGFTVFSTTSKAWKGTVMVDNIQLKTASMTQKITFDKKDYQGFYVSNWASGGDTKASVAKI